jgi:ketosteroid isomerase-like protein
MDFANPPLDQRDTGRAMSQENVELTYGALDAFSRGDFDALLAMFYEDVEVFSRLAPLGDGSYRGHDGVRSWWQNLHDAFPDLALEVLEVRDLGDVTLGAVRFHGHGRQSGAPIDETFWQVAHWRDGNVIRYSSHNSEAEALEAVGLSE